MVRHVLVPAAVPARAVRLAVHCVVILRAAHIRRRTLSAPAPAPAPALAPLMPAPTRTATCSFVRGMMVDVWGLRCEFKAGSTVVFLYVSMSSMSPVAFRHYCDGCFSHDSFH